MNYLSIFYRSNLIDLNNKYPNFRICYISKKGKDAVGIPIFKIIVSNSKNKCLV